MKRETFLIAFLLIGGPAYAGPLGTFMGQAESEFEALEQGVEPTLYLSTTAPDPSPLFQKYIYRIGVEGLCSVRGNGVMSVGTDLENSTKFQFIPILTALKTKYGEPTETNIFQGWYQDKQPFSFVDELAGNDKSYWYSWESNLDRPLPFDLHAVSFNASPKSPTEAYINISYEYKNLTTCESSEIRAATDSL
ncbi:hypothetical protein GCM10009069_23390 [Algimonas arctica]|uniref:Uncharacterized protein n=1 Tax=Algimonas arctica TaxID=1479486 RepID=A0A8J3G2V5_9PROT|nr:hypothetical protein [Algimonas arctica]GHA99894.1 hypothetical protein GCM10009069_23390 [Algimonas arctica]